jgi:galactokinase/mevalonate kinase-like predicted kinase
MAANSGAAALDIALKLTNIKPEKEVMVRCDLRKFGELLHEGWEIKNTLFANISNPAVMCLYQAARDCGALAANCLAPTEGAT